MNGMVIGVGGVGGFFGATLARGGMAMTFVAREANLQAMRAHGLHVQGVADSFHLANVNVVENPADAPRPDFVLLAVKTYSIAEAGRQLRSIVGPETVVITVQNGIDNDKRARNAIGAGQIYPGNALIVSRRAAPGRIEQTSGPRKLLFGDPSNPTNARLAQIAEAFRKAGVDATASDDILRDIWTKFVLIVAFGGLTALSRSAIGPVLRDPRSQSRDDHAPRPPKQPFRGGKEFWAVGQELETEPGVLAAGHRALERRLLASFCRWATTITARRAERDRDSESPFTSRDRDRHLRPQLPS